MLIRLLFLFVAYLMGSIPTGIWYSKFVHKEDIRMFGSKNSGATNIGRTYGAKAAIFVGVADALKALLPMWFAKLVGFPHDATMIMLTGICLVLGHAYPIFAQFKGGKVVATSIGVLIGYHFLGGLTMLTCFLILMYLTSTVSLSALFSYGITALIILLKAEQPIYGYGFLLITCFMFYRHRENIQRLLKGQEKRINWGLRKPK